MARKNVSKPSIPSRYKEQTSTEREWTDEDIDFYVRYVSVYGDDDLGGGIAGGNLDHREKLRAEYSNIEAMVKWCLKKKPRPNEQLVTLVEKISTYQMDTGRWLTRLDFCTETFPFTKNPTSQAGLLTRRAWSLLLLGDYFEAREVLGQARAIAQKQITKALTKRLVQIHRYLGYLTALEARQHNAGWLYDDALSLYDTSEILARENGDQLGAVEAQMFRGRTLSMKGDYEEARCSLITTLRQHPKTTFPRQYAFGLRLLGDIAAAQGKRSKARYYFNAVLALSQPSETSGYFEPHEVVQTRRSLGDLEQIERRIPQAIEQYEHALNDLFGAGPIGMRQEALDLAVKLSRLGRYAIMQNPATRAMPKAELPPHYEPHAPTSVAKKVKDLITGWRANRSEPTQEEQALELFLNHPDNIVMFDELTPLLGGANGAESVTRSRIARLNEKLAGEGYRIIHKTAYQLVPLDTSLPEPENEE